MKHKPTPTLVEYASKHGRITASIIMKATDMIHMEKGKIMLVYNEIDAQDDRFLTLAKVWHTTPGTRSHKWALDRRIEG